MNKDLLPKKIKTLHFLKYSKYWWIRCMANLGREILAFKEF